MATPLDLDALVALQREPTRSWSDVFDRLDRPGCGGPVTFEIRDPDVWRRLAEICDALKLPRAEESCGSAIDDFWTGQTAHWLLDGCLLENDGNVPDPDELKPYGCYLFGTKTFRFACHVLGLRQRRRFEDEPSVPSFWELCVQLERQSRDADHEYRQCEPAFPLPDRPWISPLAPEGQAYASVWVTSRPRPADGFVDEVARATRREMRDRKIAQPLDGPLFAVLVFVLGEAANDGEPVELEPLQRALLAGLERGGLWSKRDRLRGVLAYVRRVEEHPRELVGALAAVYRASDMAAAMPSQREWYLCPRTLLQAVDPTVPRPTP